MSNQRISNNEQHSSAVIVADGKFPDHEIPLKVLADAEIIVCCDGATSKVDSFGKNPYAIVGDLDSVSDALKKKYSDRLFHYPDQDSNDLTKSVKWCLERNFKDIIIVGATGLREDHTLGNIGLLTNYARLGANVRMLTDTGYFMPLVSNSAIDSFEGQQISIFSPNNSTKITTKNLRYPIDNRALEEYWMGTLNESLGNSFELQFDIGPLIVYLKY